MPCYHPIQAWRGEKTASGKRKLVFSASSGAVGLPLEIPCGQCIGCRLNKSQQWATRCVHEAAFHEENAFLTLTYRPESLPENGTLRPQDAGRFIRRLRAHLGAKRVRFFLCGEYGDRFGRPHYHVLLFGHEFLEDRVPFRATPYGRTYTSETLSRLWTHGNCEIGSLTSKSAGYVARYSLKKVNGKAAADHYTRVNLDTGEVFQLHPEFAVMSRRPGIGFEWFQKFSTDLRDDIVVLLNPDGSRKVAMPKYYDKLLPGGELERRKVERKRNARKHRADQTPARLAVREEVKRAQIKSLSKGDPT